MQIHSTVSDANRTALLDSTSGVLKSKAVWYDQLNSMAETYKYLYVDDIFKSYVGDEAN